MSGRSPSPRIIVALVGAVALAAVATVVTLACAQGPSSADGGGPLPAPTGAPPTTAPGTPPAINAAPASNSPNVKIVVKVIPPTTRATVTWGKKKLGFLKPKAPPLVIVRPRDSGPLDLVVRAEGCLPVHTCAYTFTDSTLVVRVTPEEKKNTLYGYREDLPPDVDGGVPPSLGGADGGVVAPAGAAGSP